MDGELMNLEMFVLRVVMGAFKSREVLEAEWPEDAPELDDDRAMLNNWTTLVNRQGTMLAHLSVVPSTRAELMERMPGLVNLAPAWIDAQVNEKPLTWRVFFTGLAQTAAEQREAFERVMAEQMSDPEPTEEVLAEDPVPSGDPDEDRSDLMSGVIHALTAHTAALTDIAHDLEVQYGTVWTTLDELGEPWNEDEEDEEEEPL